MTHFQYTVGDEVQDLTVDPPQCGVVYAKHEKHPDAYFVRINGAVNDVVVHARNLALLWRYAPPEVIAS